ncbi:hypothetical protein [Microbulbifer sp. SAOS-129_SWC]|uniref:hypothetical protein n=1 Tax=Microbulbifer sp. SAOS-129_SWC TaxID=3145235 RepID=UPI003216D4F4
MKKRITSTLLGVLLAGCASHSTYHISAANPEAVNALATLYLEIDPLENAPLVVEVRPEPWRYYPGVTSELLTAQYPVQSSPGASAGQVAAAGAVSGLVGSLLASGMVKSAAQDKAQLPAKPLLERLASGALQRDVREDIVDDMLRSNFALEHSLRYAAHDSGASAELRLQPSIKLTNSLGVLKFNINAELREPSGRLLYRNSIEYWSAGSGAAGDKAKNLDYWQQRNQSAFYAELRRGIDYTTDYLAQSLDGSLPVAGAPVATHKIDCKHGWVLLRGNLIRSTDEYTVLRDLRGNIKVIAGKLVL